MYFMAMKMMIGLKLFLQAAGALTTEIHRYSQIQRDPITADIFMQMMLHHPSCILSARLHVGKI